MLLRFTFGNFRSFRNEQELSLIAGSGSDTEASFPVPGVKEAILPVCGIYGANASGKSNVLKALSFVQEAVLNSHRLWEPSGPIPIQMFKGDSDGTAEFVVDFVVEAVRYQLGFKATSMEIAEEWLFSYPNGRKQNLYTRSGPAAITFGRTLAGDNRTIASLMRKNSLYLSTAAQNNHEALRPVYNWFHRSIDFVFERSIDFAGETGSMCRFDEPRQEILDMMRFADLGVVSLRLEDVTGIDPGIRFLHSVGDKVVEFDPNDESQGTAAYFSLLGPVLTALKRGAVLAVDEIDSSLHPSLTAFLVRLFGNKNSNPTAAQLIFSTHDTSLLSDGILKRDQVWFTEKDRVGVSQLYPLTDFKPRTGENFEKRYLQGRFGAIPFINSERIPGGINPDAQTR